MPSFGPNLDDPKLFDRHPGVPILDVHERGGRVVDEARLRLVAANSNARAARGELGLLLIGHTTEDGKEIDQPPLAGYVQNYAMGTHDGRPCILADLFYRRDKPEAFDYPRRSVEVVYSDKAPADNFIDAVALLRRTPERPLGLVSYSAGSRQKERYSMATSETTAGVTEGDIPALQAFMSRAGITDVAAGIKGFLAAKADGTLPAAEEFGKDDIKPMEQYAKRHKIDLMSPGGYKQAVERYKADKRAGTLYRT